MNRLRLLAQITHVVQVRSTKGHLYPAWETIAGFNCRPAADAYMRGCGETNRHMAEYRVLGTRAADQIRVENSSG